MNQAGGNYEQVLIVESSGENVCVCIFNSNRLKGAPKLICVCVAKSNTSPAQKESLISRRKILGKEAGMS